MLIVAIKNMSAGNESVGEMWQETRIFDETVTLSKVMEWIENSPKKNVILSIAQ